MAGALEKQVGGTHYKKMKIQPVEFIFKNDLPFIEGCIIKYICRWRDKGGLADLEKVKHYVDLLMDLELAQQERKTQLHYQEMEKRGETSTGHLAPTTRCVP